MKLLVKKLQEDAVLPSYGSEDAAGLDLCAYGEHKVLAHTRKLIPTGICIEWKQNETNEFLDKINELMYPEQQEKQQQEKQQKYYMRIAPRSGLSVKHSIDIGAGVIDADYRGEIKICFINNSDLDYEIKHGERIAQGILEKISRFQQIIQIDELSSTDRGQGGFGSTGKL
jgi:dUTP pyrophosphatase